MSVNQRPRPRITNFRLLCLTFSMMTFALLAAVSLVALRSAQTETNDMRQRLKRSEAARTTLGLSLKGMKESVEKLGTQASDAFVAQKKLEAELKQAHDDLVTLQAEQRGMKRELESSKQAELLCSDKNRGLTDQVAELQSKLDQASNKLSAAQAAMEVVKDQQVQTVQEVQQQAAAAAEQAAVAAKAAADAAAGHAATQGAAAGGVAAKAAAAAGVGAGLDREDRAGGATVTNSLGQAVAAVEAASASASSGGGGVGSGATTGSHAEADGTASSSTGAAGGAGSKQQQAAADALANQQAIYGIGDAAADDAGGDAAAGGAGAGGAGAGLATAAGVAGGRRGVGTGLGSGDQLHVGGGDQQQQAAAGAAQAAGAGRAAGAAAGSAADSGGALFGAGMQTGGGAEAAGDAADRGSDIGELVLRTDTDAQAKDSGAVHVGAGAEGRLDDKIMSQAERAAMAQGGQGAGRAAGAGSHTATQHEQQQGGGGGGQQAHSIHDSKMGSDAQGMPKLIV